MRELVCAKRRRPIPPHNFGKEFLGNNPFFKMGFPYVVEYIYIVGDIKEPGSA